LRVPELGGARDDVPLLLPGRPRAQGAAVFVVEKVPDQATNDTVRGVFCARPAAPLHHVQLPQGVRVYHHGPRSSLLHALPQLLYQGIHHQEEEDKLETSSISFNTKIVECSTFFITCILYSNKLFNYDFNLISILISLISLIAIFLSLFKHFYHIFVILHICYVD